MLHPTCNYAILHSVARLDSALQSPSRPSLHAALRVVGELGKARAAAHALGYEAEDEVYVPEGDEDGGDEEDDFARGGHCFPCFPLIQNALGAL